MNIRDIYKQAAKNIRELSPDEAADSVAAFAKHSGIGSPVIRELTGGFSSQAVDHTVVRLLGIRANGGKPIAKDYTF